LRISGGEAKGTKLAVPPGARPVSERVRQAVFSSLGGVVTGARVLDLYAGSGAYGLEALSRGAASAVFVDRDERAVAACRANIEAAGFGPRARVVRAPAERYVRRRGSEGSFDLVFVDPPYARAEQGEHLLEGFLGLLSEAGRVVVECRRSLEEPRPPDGLVVEADRRYGDTRVLIFRLGAR
jgi:16S rRNA (guanine966-N2)-methyltransferase